MAYDEATWEKKDDIAEKFGDAIKAFKSREKVPPSSERVIPKVIFNCVNSFNVNSYAYELIHYQRPKPEDFDEDLDLPVFKDGHELRDYQENGVRWLVFCWFQRRNSILADEMGLVRFFFPP